MSLLEKGADLDEYAEPYSIGNEARQSEWCELGAG
jgi:hypothetical protein